MTDRQTPLLGKIALAGLTSALTYRALTACVGVSARTAGAVAGGAGVLVASVLVEELRRVRRAGG